MSLTYEPASEPLSTFVYMYTYIYIYIYIHHSAWSVSSRVGAYFKELGAKVAKATQRCLPPYRATSLTRNRYPVETYVRLPTTVPLLLFITLKPRVE